jgi:hypothetical protein
MTMQRRPDTREGMEGKRMQTGRIDKPTASDASVDR